MDSHIKRILVIQEKSPSIELLEMLIKKRFKVEFHDPYIKRYDFIRNKNFNNSSISLSSIKKYRNNGIVIIGTDHENIKYSKILKNSNLIFDTRGVYQNLRDKKLFLFK